MWLPAGRRQFGEVWPGIVATLLWLACGFLFGRYLADFANAYVTYYAGLASAMIALVFLISRLDFYLRRRAQRRNRARARRQTRRRLRPRSRAAAGFRLRRNERRIAGAAGQRLDLSGQCNGR